MIINTSVPISIDVSQDRYLVNLQFAWLNSITDSNYVPTLKHYNLTQVSTDLSYSIINQNVDTFNLRSIQGNAILPRLRTITGTVTWAGESGTDIAGPFTIVCDGGLTYCLRPQQPLGTVVVSVVTFSLPLIMPVDGIISFYRGRNSAGYSYSSSASICLLTWEQPSYIGVM